MTTKAAPAAPTQRAQVLLTPAQAAARLNITRGSLRRMAAAGAAPQAVRVAVEVVRSRLADIEG
jgi:hypothetical protein